MYNYCTMFNTEITDELEFVAQSELTKKAHKSYAVTYK